MLPTHRGVDAPVAEVVLALDVVLVLEAVGAEAGAVLEDADEVDDAASVTTLVDDPQPDRALAAIKTPRATAALMPLLSL